MQNITPCLWFDGKAEEAAKYYVTVFPNSRILETTHYLDNAPLPAGTVLTVRFVLDGQEFTALNAGPEFTFSEAISFEIDCKEQKDVDYYWNTLAAGGEESVCGWLKDKYGVSWQVVPSEISKWLNSPDRAASQRVLDALMQMKKIDIAELQHAFEG